jgi:hypothetical protein
LQSFFDAYKALPIQHQLDYAIYKLDSDNNYFSAMPRRQSEDAVAEGGQAWTNYFAMIAADNVTPLPKRRRS